ncbi:hypothetical protein TRFO_04430 [Tritrichomonas foetus]|uniref:Uncharacterized protein n=1 Tax=Tritrichomonas foetus TaxID=1144522 RepID=A0A1J4KJL2_9EUKA|nr:hypothetical protein TRFO_04430 [Tritrichomonas foetus]|eukprot:OHT09886.1 hypothetical protein TRFO_04430 [Tritrichomonas foetus]
MRYARHSALATDRICGTLLAFSNRLEELNIIPKDRKTKKIRDQHLKKHRLELNIPKEKIEEMVKKVQGHPDPESLVASLFRDLNLRRVKKCTTKIADPDSSADEAENDADVDQEGSP